MDWKQIPSLAALRAFEATARHESYVIAARELNVTEAALRQHVRKLEDFFATALLVRKGRNIALTQDGTQLANGLSEGFAKIQTTAENLLSSSASRPVRVALPPSFAENWLMPRLPDFWALHPDIEIDLSPSIKSVDLSLGHHDLAIRYGRGDWPNGNARLITSGDYTVVASPKLSSVGTAKSIDELCDAVWLFEETRDEHRLWADSHGVDFHAPHNRSYPNNSLVLSAVRAGHGISVQSWALVENDLTTGVLVSLLREKVPKLGYYRFYQKSLTNKAKCFADWLTHISDESLVK